MAAPNPSYFAFRCCELSIGLFFASVFSYSLAAIIAILAIISLFSNYRKTQEWPKEDSGMAKVAADRPGKLTYASWNGRLWFDWFEVECAMS